MRIVSGSRKSIPLKALPGDTTRPTTDKVKESLFNILGQFLDGEHVLDLFAGSGGLGLEALSRGAEHTVFVEKNRKAVQVLEENIEKTKFKDEVTVLKMDARVAVQQLIDERKPFDLIFLDPPYAQTKLYSLGEDLIQGNILSPKGIIICEHPKDVSVDLFIPSAVCFRTEQYGSLAISFFEVLTEVNEGEEVI